MNWGTQEKPNVKRKKFKKKIENKISNAIAICSMCHIVICMSRTFICFSFGAASAPNYYYYYR